jgi:fusaric acid resistance family protein
MDETGHLAAVLRWSTGGGVDGAQVIGAGLGMAVPIFIGAAVGNPEAGLLAAVGGLMVGGAAAGPSAREQAGELVLALAPAIAASAAAALLAGRGALQDALVVLLVACAALAGGISRPAAIAATRFVLFLLIAVVVAGNVPRRWVFVLLVGVGACWGVAVNVLLGAIARALRGAAAAAVAAAPAAHTNAQRLARWRRTLRTLAGWQYTLRLTLCLAAAAMLGYLWPGHHLHWVALTVGLLTERQVEAWPVKTTQRALGTLLGVLAAGLLFGWTMPWWALAATIGILAAARPYLRARNYLAYTAVTTPLILAILDAGAPPGAAVLVDRLVATLIGAALVLAANAALRRAAGT